MICPNCGREQSSNLSKELIIYRRILGIAGSLLISLGIFFPFISFHTSESYNQFQVIGSGAFIFIIFGIIGIVTSLKDSRRGIASVGIITFLILVLEYLLANPTSLPIKIGPLSNYPYAEWGFGVMLVGSIICMLPLFIKSPENNLFLPDSISVQPNPYLITIGIAIILGIYLLPIIPGIDQGTAGWVTLARSIDICKLPGGSCSQALSWVFYFAWLSGICCTVMGFFGRKK
jgi:hypothetical protein